MYFTSGFWKMTIGFVLIILLAVLLMWIITTIDERNPDKQETETELAALSL